MIKAISTRLDVKISLMVTAILTIVIVVGMFYLIKQQGDSLEKQMLDKGKIESIIGAKMISRIIEEAIDNGVFSVGDAFDESYVAIPGFDPPKYHTKYDSYMDKSILSLEDEFLKDESAVFAVAVDRNGYLPTHNTRYQQPPTGDKEKDKVGNRTKRIFGDDVGLKAARNTTEGFLQVYHRDTGETMWDISSPIFVKRKHWGGFRIGYSLTKLSEAKTRLTISLVGVMALILILSAVSVFWLIKNALKPLKEFSRIASDLASGKVEEKIETKSEDEIGQLANVLERLRVSIKTAMERLMQKR